jgi:hypothetical protein
LNVLSNVHRTPLPVFDNQTSSFVVIDYSTVTSTLFTTLYDPYVYAPFIAEAVVGLEQGDASLFVEIFSGSQGNESLFSCSPDLPKPFSTGGQEILTAISCGDQNDPVATGLQKSLPVYERMLQTSPIFGPVLFSETSGPCSYVTISSTVFMVPISVQSLVDPF